MEIHLILEGEQVGPLSEAQVRQYLDDGLIATTDLATFEGMPDWMPLEAVLAHLAPSGQPTATESPAESAPVDSSAASAGVVEPAESPFIMPNATVGLPGEMSSLAPEEIALPLTASQKTKRKLGKIVIQPILPLETTPTVKKKTGKTAITLEPLRSTMALPPITGHLPRVRPSGKGAGRTGKVSLRIVPEQPAAIPTPAPIFEPAPEPLPTPEPEPLPAPLPNPAPVAVDDETLAPPEPIEPASSAEPEPVAESVASVTPVAPAEPVSPAAAVPPESPAPPPIPPETGAAPKPANSPPVFSVLPKESNFMPPTMRSVNQSARWKKSRFPYAGLALAALIVCVVLASIIFLATRGGTMPTSNPFDPHRTTAPPPMPSRQEQPAGPATVAELSDRGIKRQAAGDLDGAIQDFDSALALDPNAVEVFYERGLAKQAKRDLPGAIADYTQVISLDPQRANAFSNRGYIKQAQLDFDGAMADYTRALAIDPKLPKVYNDIGLIKAKRGDLDGAIAAYGQAIDIDPTMAFAFYNRGVAKNTEGNVDGAIADFTQAIAVNPKIALAYCNRGIARQSKGENDGALADFTQAVSLDPSLTDAYFNRGLIKLKRGDFDGAVDDDNHILLLDPRYGPVYYQRGLANVGKNRPAAALSDLREFCNIVARDPSADNARLFIWLMASAAKATGDIDAELSAALQNDWNSPPEDLTSKIAAFLVGHTSETDLIKNAASPDPAREPGQYCRVWYFVGMKRLLGGDATTAASDFQKSIATGQKDAWEYLFAQAELQALSAGATIGN